MYDAARPKYVIFLTDGGHNASDYDNGHLLMAANTDRAARGRCAPCSCGTRVPAGDVERLKRIATETGGQYATARRRTRRSATPSGAAWRAATNQRTIVDTNVTFKTIGTSKTISKKIAG